MQTRGAIYLHKRLVFHNGAVGRKCLILLNTPTGNDPYVFVKTTSQRKNKPSTPGCINTRSLFFIPKNTTFFHEDTWVQLFTIYPISPERIDSEPEISTIGDLSHDIIEEIVNCLLETEGDNISIIYKRLIRPPIQDSLLKLKEKYKKRR